MGLSPLSVHAASWHVSILILLVLSAGARPDALAAVGLQVTPPIVIGGRFSAIDPEKSEITVGSTELRILSTEEDWRLYVTVLEPLRRVSDGLELPVQRFHALFPDLPNELLNFQPHKLLEKAAAPIWYVKEQDWQTFQEALQDYLEETDPPGTYRTYLRFELTNTQDVSLTEPVEISVEFDLLEGATVEFLTSEIVVEVGYEDSDQGHGESFLIPVLVRANTSWELRLRGTEDYINGESGQIPLEMLSARVEPDPEAEWQALLIGFEPLSLIGLAVASGTEPLPFTITEATIPLQFAGDVPSTIHSGSYETDVEVSVQIPEGGGVR
jgi:hypothetical protein